MGAAVQPAPGARLLGTFMYVLMSLWMAVQLGAPLCAAIVEVPAPLMISLGGTTYE